MKSAKILKKGRFHVSAIWGLAILPFIAFAIFIFYSAFSKSNLFIGWDTPAYLYSVRIFAQEGLQSFLRFWEYHRFTYSLILYAFYLIWPEGLFTIARILPVLLAFLSTFLIGVLLFQWFKDRILAYLGVAFSFIWIAPYVLASNLFSQLLGLILALIWLTYAFKPQTARSQALFYMLFLLAAITHVYTMIFLYIPFILSNLTTWIASSKEKIQDYDKNQFLMRCLILGVLLVFPLLLSTILMNSTRIFGTLLNPQQIEETGVGQISPSLLLISFGGNFVFIIPIALWLLFSNFMKSKKSNEKLKYSYILWWTAFALFLPIVSYIFPHLLSLTERMIIITPIPLLMALSARKFSNILGRIAAAKKTQRFGFDRILHSRWTKVVILSGIVLSMFIANVNPIQDNAQIYLKSFIPQDTDTFLKSLNQMQFSEKPLFIIDVSETLISDYAALWDNAIGACIGPHYIYIGPIQNLANLQRTIFNSKPSDILSTKYFNQLNQSQILSYDSLANKSIILFENFYTLREYEIPYVHEVERGVFLLDFKKLWLDNPQLGDRVFIRAYMDLTDETGPWYGIKRGWSFNPYVLELYSNVSGNEFVSYNFYVSNSSVYSAKVRYFDFAGYAISLDLNIDSETVGNINYNGTMMPQISETAAIFLSIGWHEFLIKVHSSGQLIINLDYITLQP